MEIDLHREAADRPTATSGSEAAVNQRQRGQESERARRGSGETHAGREREREERRRGVHGCLTHAHADQWADK